MCPWRCSFAGRRAHEPRVALLAFPAVVAVRLKTDIAARRGRTAEADLAPGRRVRVVDFDDGAQQFMAHELLRRQARAPSGAFGFALVHGAQDQVLFGRIERAIGTVEAGWRLRLDRVEAAAPAFLKRWHRLVTRAAALV